MQRASQFYTGLVADVYDLLVAHPADPAFYAGLIEENGEPALELGCGSGDPLLALIAKGLTVEGLDSSADMLRRCETRASELGLRVALHHQEMQRLELPRRYRTIFLAGPSFMLVTEFADVRATLVRMHAHLEAGGRAVIPLFIPPRLRDAQHAGRGWRSREPVRTQDGAIVELSERFDYDRDAQLLLATLRYQLSREGREVEVVERPWSLRWYEQAEFRNLLVEAGFAQIEMVRGNRMPAAESDPVFVFLARRGLEQMPCDE